MNFFKTILPATGVRSAFVRLRFIALLLSGVPLCVLAQCPPNIDFEEGNYIYNHWERYTGFIYMVNPTTNHVTLEPSNLGDGIEFIDYSTNPGAGNDPIGQFPKNCPNGSGHSVMLHASGRDATALSYTFTVPTNANDFSITYWYAMVFQNGNHTNAQSNRVNITFKDLTEGEIGWCSTVEYICDVGDPRLSHPPGNTFSLFKKWASNTIELSNKQGHTVQLFFSITGCTEAHPGAAQSHGTNLYLDISSACTNTFSSATYCQGDTAISLTAPPGYTQYTWYDALHANVLGTQQMLTLQPPPPPGTIFLVDVATAPPATFLCPVTLSTTVNATPNVVARGGPDVTLCAQKPLRLGYPPEPGLQYHWTPSTGLNNPNIANPVCAAVVNTTYILKVTSAGGGCMDIDSVEVKPAALNNAIWITGSASNCAGAGITVLHVNPADSIQWFNQSTAIPGATDTIFTILQSGYYHAVVYNIAGGCAATTQSRDIKVLPIAEAKFAVNNAEQCFPGHSVILKDTSHFATGGLIYNWNFGDGKGANTKDATHTYASAGTLYGYFSRDR